MDANLKTEHRLTELETRLDVVEKQQADYGKLVEAVTSISEREKIVENDVKEIKSDVKTMTSKPAKRWEQVITTAITVILTAVLTYVITKLGL